MSRWLFCLEQTGDDLVGGIVGVGDEVEGLFDGGDAEECEHFVEQGAVDRDWTTPVPHGCARRAWHGEEAGGGSERAGSPPAAEVPHDEFGLGICFGLLMQELDRRHLAAALGDLDAVADQDAPAVGAQRLGE